MWRGSQAIKLPADAGGRSGLAVVRERALPRGPVCGPWDRRAPMIVSIRRRLGSGAGDYASARKKGRANSMNAGSRAWRVPRWGIARPLVPLRRRLLRRSTRYRLPPCARLPHDETAGSWGQPQEVVSSSLVRHREGAGEELSSVSCSAAGGCVALGEYGLREVGVQGHRAPVRPRNDSHAGRRCLGAGHCALAVLKPAPGAQLCARVDLLSRCRAVHERWRGRRTASSRSARLTGYGVGPARSRRRTSRAASRVGLTRLTVQRQGCA